MQKRLTISLDEHVYYALYQVIGKREISHFIENLIKPTVMRHELESAYQQMATDKKRESAAMEWTEGTMGEFHNEAW